MDVESVEIEGLACQRGGQIIVSDLTFEMRRGSAILLRGPNGSGKTTLLRTLAGFLQPAAGRITLGARENRKTGNDLSNHLHFVGHSNGVKPRLSVLENITFWQRYYAGNADIEVAEAALDSFGLLHLAEYRAAHLSQGQARRLGLARLLAAQRAIWLLDEPSASLDTVSTGMLEAAIANHVSAGGLACIATHDDLNVPRSKVLQLKLPMASPAFS